jgi:hypothetical protein
MRADGNINGDAAQAVQAGSWQTDKVLRKTTEAIARLREQAARIHALVTGRARDRRGRQAPGVERWDAASTAERRGHDFR